MFRPIRTALGATLAALAVAAGPARAGRPAVPFDLQGYVDAALASGVKRVVVPPGRYAVTPRHQQHLALHDLTGVTVVADGVEMVCTETTRALSIDRCSGVTVRGLTIDYDPLPFTQGRITAVAPDHAWVEFAVVDGYPDQQLERRIEVYDPATAALKTETEFGWQPFQPLGGRRYRVSRGPAFRFDPAKAYEGVGDVLVTNNAYAPGGSQPHAVQCRDCHGLRLEDVALYASNCFGFLEYGCDATTYLRCRLDRRSPSDDPVARGLPRMRSTDADAYHSVDAVRGPALVDCVAKYQGDDCVNIHGSYQMVVAADGPVLRVLSSGRPKIDAGDPLELLAYDGRRLPDARAVSVVADGHITPAERRFLLAQRMNESLKQAGVPDAFRVTIDRVADLPPGSVLCSGRHTGNGFRVQGCDFGFNRSRGILIKASDGVISANRITGTWGSAIQIQPEVWWLESGSSNNLLIDRNVITDCRSVAVEVTAVGGDRALAPSGAHRNVAIVDNTIVGCPLPNVWVTSTDALRVAGTVVRGPTTAPSISAGELRAAGLDPRRRTPVMTANCNAPQVASGGQ